VYQEFDTIAKRHKVFKVETIGDSYLAVTGLPDPQSKHAVIMAKFAHEIKTKFADIAKEFGPECSDLSMRLGLHSGPVTAGVLQGDRARFLVIPLTPLREWKARASQTKFKFHKRRPI
jgi:class 3 adenylate cyclase